MPQDDRWTVRRWVTKWDAKLIDSSLVYSWLDNKKEPLDISAHDYMVMVLRWINSKIHDPKAFPTDPIARSATGSATSQAPSSTSANRDWIGKNAGFPETFNHDVRSCFRHIFRIYAHLYHSHWIEPFWHLSGKNNAEGWTDLNSCFVHFCSVSKLYGLLSDEDAKPMQPLIDIWVANGSIPADAANGACAVPLPSQSI